MKGLFRLVSFLLLVLAFVVLVVDGATIISAKTFVFTSCGDLLGRFAAPGALERMAAAVSRNLHPVIWGLVNLLVLAPPAVVVLTIFGLICWMIGREKEPDLILARRD